MTESDCNSPSPETCEDSRSAYRKSNKPLMEKRRRARINTCLSELKSLVLQAMKKDNAQYSKLEKADILELTVKHLRTIQRHQMTATINNSSNVIHKYRAGFNECANEVMRYLTSVPGVQDEVKGRVLGHLANCMQTVNSAPVSNRRIQTPSTALHPSQMQHSSLMSTSGSENPTAFHPILRDQNSQLTSSVSCFTSTPVQLVQTPGPSAPVAFVLTSPSSVQAVPLYASPNSSVKMDAVVKEERPTYQPCSNFYIDDKQSAFKDFTHASHSKSRTVPMPIEIKQSNEPVWRPW
ncbi:hypothetical protein SNE40_013827 [Patella caerulea]|uniref:Uncharacterized protein n=1 Tax=Patella caerulea TaxID=87958 RepID=A0AAN8JGU0_PATCE